MAIFTVPVVNDAYPRCTARSCRWYGDEHSHIGDYAYRYPLTAPAVRLGHDAPRAAAAPRERADERARAGAGDAG